MRLRNWHIKQLDLFRSNTEINAIFEYVIREYVGNTITALELKNIHISYDGDFYGMDDI